MNAIERTPEELGAWQWLADADAGRALIAQISAALGRDGRPTPSQLEAWRRAADPIRATAAIELVRARRASAWKFADVLPGSTARAPSDVMLDVAGGEQATAWPIARHKASRFVERLGAVSSVIDACCGVGADARELVRAGLDVRAVDLDPLRTWMCEVNAGGVVGAAGKCSAEIADVVDLDVTDAALHIDPARRVESRSGARSRLRALDDLSPAISVVASLASRARAGAVKLGPGVDPPELPTLERPTSLEYISLDGQVSQAVWWTGVLADDWPVRATLIGSDGQPTFTLAGDPALNINHPENPLGTHIFTVDPAIARAGLLPSLAGEVGLAIVHPSLGLLTDEPDAGALVDHPALTPFIVRHSMPWRREHVTRWLRDRNAGIVEVKTRGKACDPDIEQRELRGNNGPAGVPYCVFVLRFGDSIRAIITERPSTTD